MSGSVDATTLLWVLLTCGLAGLLLLGLAVLTPVLRRPSFDAAAWQQVAQDQRAAAERAERELRDELSRVAAAQRQDLAALQALLLAQTGEAARAQSEQVDALRTQVASFQQAVSAALSTSMGTQASQSQSAREAQDQALRRFGEALGQQVSLLAQAQDLRWAEVRTTMETRLQAMQEGNERRLEQMRATVDEKLNATLEQRLGESFRQVAERLDQVHRGLGEMQGLARDVGALGRVLGNVKTRGVFGEVQLAALIDQVLTAEQYGTHVSTVPGSPERVEMAIRLPGQREDGLPLWLPIDAKFPREDYERLLDAHDRADAAGVDAAARALEVRLRLEARTIREKYVAPPHTTDFAILFLPAEGLYAEALRRPGLVEALQREHKVVLAGPTTLLAILSSLQMGFRTLALEKRSTEVWEILGAVKTEFGKFGEVLARTKKKLEEASLSIDAAQTRTKVMARQLKSVESLPDAPSMHGLPAAAVASGEHEA